MGKFSQSIRSLASTSLIKKPPSSISSHKPHYSPKTLTPRNPNTTKITTHNPFTSPKISDAKKVFNSIAKTHLDVRAHNALLEHYASISTIDDSITLFNHMVKTRPDFSPDRYTYHILLAQSCTAPDADLKSVLSVLNFMVSNGCNPTKFTTDVVVRSLCSAGHLELAVDAVRELAQKNAVPDSHTYHLLIKCLCKSRTYDIVMQFIDDMREFGGVEPDLVTYTIMIDNLSHVVDLRNAEKLIDSLHECGFEPDCCIYNAVMKGYCTLSMGNEVVKVLKTMQEKGVEPDIVTYNTLIFGLSKCGRFVEAKKYLRTMVEMGHFPDTVTYTTLMNGMCRKGDALGALGLLEEMEARGCTPNSFTYNTLLFGLFKAKLLEKGMQFYEMMKEGEVKLDTASYGAMVRALCRDGRVAEAYGVFDYAVESKSLTDVNAYLTLEIALKQLKKAQP